MTARSINIQDLMFIYENSKVLNNSLSTRLGSPSNKELDVNNNNFSPLGVMALSLENGDTKEEKEAKKEKEIQDLMTSQVFLQDLNGVSIHALHNPLNLFLLELSPQTIGITVNFAFKYEMKDFNIYYEEIHKSIKYLTEVRFIQYLYDPIIKNLSSFFTYRLINAFIKRGNKEDINKEDILPGDIYASPSIFSFYCGLFPEELSSIFKIGIEATNFSGDAEYLKYTLTKMYSTYNEKFGFNESMHIVNSYLMDYDKANPYIALELYKISGRPIEHGQEIFSEIVIRQDLSEIVVEYFGSENFELETIMTRLLRENSIKSILAVLNKYISIHGNDQTIQSVLFKAFEEKGIYYTNILFILSLHYAYDFTSVLNKYKQEYVRHGYDEPITFGEYNEHFKDHHIISIKSKEDLELFNQFNKRYIECDLLSFIDICNYPIDSNNFEVFKSIEETYGEKCIIDHVMLKLCDKYDDDPETYLKYMEYIFERYPQLFNTYLYQIVEHIAMKFKYLDEKVTDYIVPNTENNYNTITYLLIKGVNIEHKHISLSIKHHNIKLFQQFISLTDTFLQKGVTEIALTQSKFVPVFLGSVPKHLKVTMYHVMSLNRCYKYKNLRETFNLDYLFKNIHIVTNEEVLGAISSGILQNVKDLFNNLGYIFNKGDYVIATCYGNVEIVSYIISKIEKDQPYIKHGKLNTIFKILSSSSVSKLSSVKNDTLTDLFDDLNNKGYKLAPTVLEDIYEDEYPENDVYEEAEADVNGLNIPDVIPFIPDMISGIPDGLSQVNRNVFEFRVKDTISFTGKQVNFQSPTSHLVPIPTFSLGPHSSNNQNIQSSSLLNFSTIPTLDKDYDDNSSESSESGDEYFHGESVQRDLESESGDGSIDGDGSDVDFFRG